MRSSKVNKTALLFSAGIDSFIAYFFIKNIIGDDCDLLYYDLGTNYTAEEKVAAEKLFPGKVKYIEDLNYLGSKEHGVNAVIPNRNIIMAIHAVSNLGYEKVYIAGLKDDNAPDKTEFVFNDLSKLLSMTTGKHIVITSPFWDYTKHYIVDWYINDFNGTVKLLQTFSCYTPIDGKECNNCKACFRKSTVLYSAAKIQRPFFNKAIVADYIKHLDFYNGERGKNMLDYISLVVREWAK